MFVPFLLLIVFSPFVSATGHLTITIQSELDLELTLILTGENLYHGFKRNLTEWKNEVFIHHNLTLGKVHNFSFVTKEPSGRNHTKFAPSFLALRGFYDIMGEELFLRKIELKVACDQNFHGKFCDQFCDEQVASSLGKHCNINGIMEAKKTECVNGVSCQLSRAMSQCNRFFSSQTCGSLVNIWKFFGVI